MSCDRLKPPKPPPLDGGFHNHPAKANLKNLSLTKELESNPRKWGDVREDGYVFRRYTRTNAGTLIEHWNSPEAWERQKTNTRECQRRRRARKLGVDYDSAAASQPKPERCPYLDIPLSTADSVPGQGPQDSSPSLDRVNSSEGYTLENTIWVSHRANRIKNNASIEELITLTNSLVTLHVAKVLEGLYAN